MGFLFFIFYKKPNRHLKRPNTQDSLNGFWLNVIVQSLKLTTFTESEGNIMKHSMISGIMALTLTTIAVFSHGVDVKASEKNGTTDIAIGTTGYVISVPSDYYSADVTDVERRDDMIAYYKSDKHLMDFDVYQYAKDGRTLKEYTEIESKEYGAEKFEEISINDIDITLYYSEEKYDGIEYRVANYIFETDEDFGELAFWLDGDDAEELTEEIMATIKYVDQTE